MHYSTFMLHVAVVLCPIFLPASAAPYRKRGASATEILVFQFADVLEQLETAFYTQALAKFQDPDFATAGFSETQIPIEQFTSIQADESTHSSVLQSALQSFGAMPITSCQFNFDSVLTDVSTMAATARVVENVGVSAYLGGLTLLTDPALVAAAGSILSVEARHQTILNVLSGTGTAIPSAFDIPLSPSEILALAGGFFSGPCDLGIPANPSLAITNAGNVGPGTLLTFSSPALNGTINESSMFCQMLLGGQPFSIPFPLSQCVVPDINGPVVIFITSDGQPLLNDVNDRATTQLVAGPTMAFIDAQPQALGQLVRSSGAAAAQGNGSVTTTTTTTTLSLAQASQVVSQLEISATST